MSSHASFWEAVVGAVQSLRGSKLRSFLTLLGIILATTTLIAVMSVISGMDVVYRPECLRIWAPTATASPASSLTMDYKKYLEMLRRNPPAEAARNSNFCARTPR